MTLVLPEPAGRSLDDISGRDDAISPSRLMLAEAEIQAVVPEG